MESNSMSDSLPSSEGVIDEIDLKDSGRTSLGLSSSAGPAESVVLNKSEKDSTESEIQDSILFNLDASMSKSVSPTNPVDLNESISIIDPPNSVYIDTDDPSIIDLSKDPQEVVFGQYGGHGAIPAHVWSRRLDKQFKPLKEFKVSISEGLRLLGLGYRMYKYTNREKGAGRLPVIDPFGTPKATPTMGVPLGGLGSGTIGRGWRGEFNKWQIYSGTPKPRVVEADAFSAFIEFDSPPETTSPRLTRTPNPNPNPNLKTWNWKVKGDKTTYNALYPRAWTVYEEPHPDIRLECRQISPVIPHNYKESSYPVGVFVWKITNNAKTNAKVSIMFSFQNGSGGLNDLEGGHVNKLFETTRYDDKITGVTMSHNRIHPIRKQNTSTKSSFSDTNLKSSTSIENTADSSSSISSSSASSASSSTPMEKKKKIKPVSKQVNSDHVVKNYSDPVTFAIGVKQSYGMEVSYNTKWATNSKASATALWDEFSSNGKLKNNNDERPSQKGESIGSALAAKVIISNYIFFILSLCRLTIY